MRSVKNFKYYIQEKLVTDVTLKVELPYKI